MKIKRITTAILVLLSSILMFGFSFSDNEEPFLSEIGVCTKFQNAENFSQHGYSFIEERVGRFLVPTKSDEEFNLILDQAKKSPIPVKVCNMFIPGSMKSVGPDAIQPEILKYMEISFQRAEKAGVEQIVFGSGGSRNIPKNFSRTAARKQFVNLCKEMAPIAAKYNVVVVLEPLNKKESNFINSVTEGGEIVKEVNHPNFLLLADIYHMNMDDEGPESIIEYGHLIKHVHIAEKKGRAAPGKHKEDFSAYFEALKEVNYQGRISMECTWEDMEIESGIAINTIKKQCLILN